MIINLLYFSAGEYRLPWGVIVQSEHEAHPKFDVIQNVLDRNPGVNLGNLTDWDLIDLYFRYDPGLPQSLRVGPPPKNMFMYSENLYVQRGYFSFNTDSYIQDSNRDSQMLAETQNHILEFYKTPECDIDWRKPEDTELRYFLAYGLISGVNH